MTKGQWITLDSVILDYIEESEQNISKYYKLFHSAFRCMDDLGVDFFYEIRTFKLPINSNGTVTIPENVLNWVKVGLFTFNGEIVPLQYNHRLSNYADLNPNRLTKNSDVTFGNLNTLYSITSPSFYNYWDGFGFGYLNGNGWTGGTFKVDMVNNVIVLDNWNNCSYIVLEAMISPQEGQDYYVPMVFREAIISWIGWKDIIHLPNSRKGNLSDKRDRRHEYFEARRRGQSKWKPFILEQAELI